MRKTGLILMLALLLGACNNAKMKKVKKLHIRIIETTDVHGAIFPEDLINQDKRKGSLAQVYTYVKEQRAKDDREVIFVDNGDILQGTPVVYYYNFEASDSLHLLAQVMNYMKYDVGTVGNHDIEAGHEVYDKFRSELTFDWMAANAVRNDDGKPYFKPYKIIEKQGVKIAFLGLITPAVPNWLPPEIYNGMHFDDMIESARYWEKYIREKEHPDVMIGLFHSGVDASYGGADPKAPKNENAAALVAQQVPGFDIIFAGHDHRISDFYVENPAGDSTLIIDPAAHAEHVGVGDIFLTLNDSTGKYDIKTEGKIVSMEDVKPDSAFRYKFNTQLVAVERWVKRPVGVLKNRINAADALYGPSPFVDLIHKVQLELSGADVSFAAPFSLSAVLEPGQLYVRDMFKIYRYENFLYTMKMSGEEIRKYLEFSYSLWLDGSTSPEAPLLLFKSNDEGEKSLKNPYYNFDSGAGIKYIVDTQKPVGERVKIISMADGSAFNPKKSYLVAMNSYRGNGGGSHLTKGAGIPKDSLQSRLVKSSKEDFRLLFMKWIERQKYVKAASLNQWRILPSERVLKAKISGL